MSSTMIDLAGLPEPVVQSIKRLVESLREAAPASAPAGTRTPLRGRFAGLNLPLPPEDFDKARREAWANFPRDLPEAGGP